MVVFEEVGGVTMLLWGACCELIVVEMVKGVVVGEVVCCGMPSIATKMIMIRNEKKNDEE